MAAPKKGTVLYNRTLDEVEGILVDIVEVANENTGNVYLNLVFEDGKTIAMPLNFRVKYDLIAGESYAAKWDEGKFTVVPSDLAGEEF